MTAGDDGVERLGLIHEAGDLDGRISIIRRRARRPRGRS